MSEKPNVMLWMYSNKNPSPTECLTLHPSSFTVRWDGQKIDNGCVRLQGKLENGEIFIIRPLDVMAIPVNVDGENMLRVHAMVEQNVVDELRDLANKGSEKKCDDHDCKHHHRSEHLCQCHRSFLERQTRALERIAAGCDRKHQSPIIDADAEQAKKAAPEPLLKPGEYEATIDDLHMPSHDCLVIDYRIGSRVISKQLPIGCYSLEDILTVFGGLYDARVSHKVIVGVCNNCNYVIPAGHPGPKEDIHIKAFVQDSQGNVTEIDPDKVLVAPDEAKEKAEHEAKILSQ